MKKNVNFKTQLKKGNKGEKLTKDFLEKNGYKFLTYGTTNLFDICMIDETTTEKVLFECKTEFVNSGNFGVEIAEKNMSSGLTVTMSDFYVFISVTDRTLTIIDTHTLKQMCFDNCYRKVNGGNNNTATLLLVPKEELKEKAVITKQF